MNNKVISLLSLLLIGQNALAVFAGTSGEARGRPYHLFIQMGAGVAWQKTGGSQAVNLLPPDSNYYTAKSDYYSAASLNLALGFEQLINDKFSYQLGIATYGNTTVKPCGHVWQFSLPEFDNFTYRYKTQSTAVVLAGKFLTSYNAIVHPYLSANIGAGFNRAFSYHETPLIEEAAAMAPFRNRTYTSLAWGVGSGLEIDITPAARFGIGYQFADFGKATLGPSPDQVGTDTLKQRQIFTHQMLFQLTLFV